MNFSSISKYSPSSGSSLSFNNYRKYVDSKLLCERKALQKSYKTVMNSIDKSLSIPSPSRCSGFCLKSAPVESDSDDYFENQIFTLPSKPQPSSNKSKLNFNHNEYLELSHQPFMDYFNEFDSSLQSLQEEINEISRTIEKNHSSTTT